MSGEKEPPSLREVDFGKAERRREFYVAEI
jgi:hypothetical protein